MFKRIGFAIVGVSLLASPLVASADTFSDIQAKIQSLLAQIASLQQQIAALTASATSSDAITWSQPPVRPERPCPVFERNLWYGSQGSDVSDLQESLGMSPTGFFGAQTQSAVQDWQSENGVRATGYFGPMSRRSWRCPPQPSNTFSATPTSGAAPLAVTFSGSSGQRVTSEVAVWIDFGDGSVDDSIGPGSFLKTHTYTAPGIYTAKLQWRNFGPASSNFPMNTVGTVMITVSICPPNADNCNFRTLGAPSISGVDGPTTLQVNQQGTWSVHVNDSSGYLSYAVRWGDEAPTPLMYGTSTSMPISSSGTFTHTYATAGTYSPTFTVTNANGQSASASATVVVGTNQANAPSIRVLSPNGGETLTAGFITTVRWDASNVPPTTYDGGVPISYKIRLSLINFSGDGVGGIGSNLLDGMARSTEWDPASLNGGFAPLNQLKVRASLIKQTNRCVSSAASYTSFATSPIACITEETVASDDSDGWFSVHGVSVCNNRVTPMTCAVQ